MNSARSPKNVKLLQGTASFNLPLTFNVNRGKVTMNEFDTSNYPDYYPELGFRRISLLEVTFIFDIISNIAINLNI